MNRLRSLIRQSPAIAIATAALALSTAGGATAASVASQAPATPVTWHNLTLINGWTYGGFGSFHVAYYVDPGHVVHLRGSVKNGQSGPTCCGAAFVLPPGIRPSHTLRMAIFEHGNAQVLDIFPNGQVLPFDQTIGDQFARDYSSFDGVSWPLG
jgi:hypothetical protein